MRSFIFIVIICSNFINAQTSNKFNRDHFIKTNSSSLLIQEYFATQLDSNKNASLKNSFRFELGLGFSIAGDGGGLNGRLAVVFFFGKWGGTIRFTGHPGGEGEFVGGFFGPYRPKEKFYERAFMLSHSSKYSKKSRFIKSAGIGFCSGERLSKDKTDLKEFSGVPGFAYEIGIASGESVFGITLSLIGNLNSVSSIYGFQLSLSLGS